MPASGGKFAPWLNRSASAKPTESAGLVLADRGPFGLCSLWAILSLGLFMAALAGVSQAGAVDSVRGRAIIIDGDTLQVAGSSFNLVGIDAPELEQRCQMHGRFYGCGSLAQAALMDLTAGIEVVCRKVRDRHADPGSGALARCSAGGYNLSEGMIYTGWALMPPAAAGNPAPEAFLAVQAQAEERRRGLWQGKFVTPWDWRAGERLPGE